MKNIFFFLLLVVQPLAAKTATDTITTWKLYKDTTLLLHGAEFGKTNTVTLNKSDDFKELRLVINCDTRAGNVRRKLLFKRDGKLMATLVKILKKSTDAFILSKKELIWNIGPDINKPFILEFTDGTGTTGITIGTIILSDK